MKSMLRFSILLHCCEITLLLLSASALTRAQTQSLSEMGVAASLAQPADYTNVVYISRAISSDGKFLRLTRYWLSGTRVHLVTEEITNAFNATSLQGISESVWTNGCVTLELIRNERGTFIRRKRPSDWDDVVERAKRDVASKGKEVEFHVLDPEAWQEMSEPNSLLANYSLTIDADENARNSLSTSGIVKEKGRLAYYRDDPERSLAWELIFDPVTGLKSAERRWLGGQLVFEARWDTTSAILASQFDIPARELEAWRRRFGEKSAGIGLIFKPNQKTGPFTVAGVLSNSPAATAHIKPGSVLVAIQNRNTQGMQKEEAVNLLRGLPGTRLIVTIADAQTQERRKLELERQLLRPARLNEQRDKM